jgi:hypothetical protein
MMIIIIMLPNQAIASTPSAPRPSGAEGRGSTAPLCLQLLHICIMMMEVTEVTSAVRANASAHVTGTTSIHILDVTRREHRPFFEPMTGSPNIRHARDSQERQHANWKVPVT